MNISHLFSALLYCIGSKNLPKSPTMKLKAINGKVFSSENFTNALSVKKFRNPHSITPISSLWKKIYGQRFYEGNKFYKNLEFPAENRLSSFIVFLSSCFRFASSMIDPCISCSRLKATRIFWWPGLLRSSFSFFRIFFWCDSIKDSDSLKRFIQEGWLLDQSIFEWLIL